MLKRIQLILATGQITILCLLFLVFLIGCIESSAKNKGGWINELNDGKEIFKFCHLYALKNQGNFPDSLKNKQFLDQIDAPSKKRIQSRQSDESYVYISGYKINGAINTIVLYGPINNHWDRDGRFVIFLDGEGQWMEEKEFQDLIRKQKKSEDPKLNIHQAW